MPAPANTSPEYTRRMNELAATVIDPFESRPQCVETLVLMSNEFLRFERQFGLPPIFGYNHALTRIIELIRTHHAYCRLLQMLKPFYCLCLGKGLTTKSIMKLEPEIQVIYPSSYHSDFLRRMLMSSCSLCLESRSTIILMNVASADNYSVSQGQSAWLPKLSKSSRILQLLMLSHQEFLFIICSEKACEKKR